jgi:PAS domain S-box-containing protein
MPAARGSRLISVLWRYALALTVVALAAALRWSLPGALAATPYLAFYPAVVAAAAFGGLGPGLLATVASALCVDLLFDYTPGRVVLSDPVVVGRLVIFLLGGGGTSLIAHWFRAAQARERLRAAEVARQKELLSVTLASIGDGVIVTDARGQVTFLNGEAERLTAWRSDEGEGKPLTSVFRIINEQTRQTAENPVEKVLRMGMVVGLANHTVLIAKDGRETPIDDSGAPIRAPDGTVHGVVLVFRDFTEQKRAEQNLQAAKAVAEAANTAKDQFLAVLSHELRTPLTPVLATVSALRESDGLDGETRDDLEMVHRNVELEARLIDDLLDVTRIAQGKVELRMQDTELGEVIRRAVEVCQPDIEARRLEFGVDIGADAPYPIHADPTRLQQVFWNLLKNAVKFTAHGGCVGIRCRRDGEYVVAEVNDSGVGIAPDALPRLFKPFEQGERGITRQFGGLGLGLTISKAMVEQHGGTICAHSDGPGKGATFRLRLPLLRAAVAEPQLATTSSAAAQAAAQPLRILLVEDHGDTARVMKRLLGASGHEVQTAGDVVTALEVVEREPLDLLISDLGLPDGSGVELMRELRRRGRTLPGIALSGYGQEQDIQQSREAGFAAHLTKPVNFPQLTGLIAQVMKPGTRG